MKYPFKQPFVPNASPPLVSGSSSASGTHDQPSTLELWGGVECTLNRVEDAYIEQLRRTGHVLRISDLDLFASLGIKALRQPVLWEAKPSHRSDNERWEWAKRWLGRLDELGIRPIVGLLHHGSGPRHTNLLDPDFPRKLAEYAGEVARRFPHVRDYTPVNEPLTTARFSALYGHWYPHAKDERSFSSAILNQCKAVVLSMEAIRRVNPSARLIQTDDLGKTHSSPALAYQAEFENERRWLAYDLLAGRVDSEHRMWHHLRWAGIDESTLQWFLDHPCPPDVVGINHYLSGERYLDENLARYPSDTHGGNGRDGYADVLAARVLLRGPAGPAALMMEAWERYHTPVAITECHNGCTREEQLRWFREVWQGAEKARAEGGEIVAVTAWSLLGAFDWNRLVTEKTDDYEPGVYDIRGGVPRPTALTTLIRDCNSGIGATHPVLQVPGWWRRSQRFVYDFCLDAEGNIQPAKKESINEAFPELKPVLITGGKGSLGQAFAHICEFRGIPYRTCSRRDLDITDATSIRRALLEHRPWAVINAAGYTRIDQAESNPVRCFLDNTRGAHLLAQECASRGLPLVGFSSDLVFDGAKAEPYVESDLRLPLNVYGKSKAQAEDLVLKTFSSSLVVRSAAFFGPWDERNFITFALRALSADDELLVTRDIVISPTYLPDLANATMDLLLDGERGIWHLTNVGKLSWADLVEDCASRAGLSTRSLRTCRLDELDLPARRPHFSALSSERGLMMPSLADALTRYFRHTEVNWESPRTEQERAA